MIPLGGRTLRVLRVEDDDADNPQCWSLRTRPHEPTAQAAADFVG